MRVTIKKEIDKFRKGQVIEVTNDFGRELITTGFARDTAEVPTDEREVIKVTKLHKKKANKQEV